MYIFGVIAIILISRYVFKVLAFFILGDYARVRQREKTLFITTLVALGLIHFMLPPGSPIYKTAQIEFDKCRTPNSDINFIQRTVTKVDSKDDKEFTGTKSLDPCNYKKGKTYFDNDVTASDFLSKDINVTKELLYHKIHPALTRLEVLSFYKKDILDYKLLSYGLWDQVGKIEFIKKEFGETSDRVFAESKLSCRIMLPPNHGKGIERVCDIAVPTSFAFDIADTTCILKLSDKTKLLKKEKSEKKKQADTKNDACWVDGLKSVSRLRFPIVTFKVSKQDVVIDFNPTFEKGKHLSEAKGLVYEVSFNDPKHKKNWRELPLKLSFKEFQKLYSQKLFLKLSSLEKNRYFLTYYKKRQHFDEVDRREIRKFVSAGVKFIKANKKPVFAKELSRRGLYSKVGNIQSLLKLSTDFVQNKPTAQPSDTLKGALYHGIQKSLKDHVHATGGNSVCPNVYKSKNISALLEQYGLKLKSLKEPSELIRRLTEKRHQGLLDFITLKDKALCQERQIILEMMARYLRKADDKKLINKAKKSI